MAVLLPGPAKIPRKTAGLPGIIFPLRPAKGLQHGHDGAAVDHKHRCAVCFLHKGTHLLPEGVCTPALELRHGLPFREPVCSAGIDEPLVIRIPGKLSVIFVLKPAKVTLRKAGHQTDGNARKILFRKGQGRRLQTAPHGACVHRRHRAQEPVKRVLPLR